MAKKRIVGNPTTTPYNPNKAVTEAIKKLESLVVEATVKIVTNEHGETIGINSSESKNTLGALIIEAYKAEKQIVLKLANKDNPREFHYSSECEWLEYGVIKWHIHIRNKCYTVALAAMEDDEITAFWYVYLDEYATEAYVNAQVGDIETALENIITKYGLGGDSV